IDPEAANKLEKAIAELKPAIESCSSTLCKRILDSLEKIMFTQEHERPSMYRRQPDAVTVSMIFLRRSLRYRMYAS
ncbi:MAG: hypothetical protein IKS37_00635, partial [Solobacterium sp.]|nr:hypothetical protein [Solobacterium sp.]